MGNYVDASAQTHWQGLMQKDIVRSDALFSPSFCLDASTPPKDSSLTVEEQPAAELPMLSPAEQRGQPHTPPTSREPSQEEILTMSTSPLLSRRHNRPGDFVPRLDLPAPSAHFIVPKPLIDEVPASPPPSALPLSPLPEANKRFAGHTPLYAGSPKQDTLRPKPSHHLQPIVPETLRSLPAHELIVEQDPSEYADREPLAEEESRSATPQEDVALTGPLTLAPNPGDGTAENIVLSALDKELSKLAQQQERGDGTAENEQPLSRQDSAESHTSHTSQPRPVDGVILKKTVPMNFGAPLGEV